MTGHTPAQVEAATGGRVTAAEVRRLVASGDLDVVPGTRRITPGQLQQLVAAVAVVEAAEECLSGVHRGAS